MIVNGKHLLAAAPLKPMETEKVKLHGVSYGLAEAGYDIRIKQSLTLHPFRRFRLASTLERFQMPDNMVAIVHDKSTWARRGLSVFNTVIEPGWHGWLTLELVYHGMSVLRVEAGSGIAQVLFHKIEQASNYSGKYQNQDNRPVAAILEKG